MNRTNFTFDKIIHTSRFRTLSRRVVSMALAGVMCLGLLPMSSLAAGAVWPLQATVNVADPSVDPAVPDGSGEAPTVTIEVNGVIDESNKLTGFVEVAIRVKPGELHLDQDGKIVNSKLDPNYDHSEVQPFSSLAVALEYSDKLTPWEWEKLDGDWNKLDVSIAGNQTTAIDASSAIGGGFSTRKMVEIDPLHKKTRIAQAAISPKGTAAGGGSEGGGTATAAEGDGDTGTATATGGGYLYLMAQDFTAKEYNNEDTVLAVVRFKYDRSTTDETKNPWSTMFPQGANNANVTDWIDPTSPDCLVKLASAATVSAPADSIIGGVELRYDSGKSATRPQGNRFYYSTDTTSADAVEAYDPSKPTTDPAYKSKTSNCMEVALVDTTAATPSTTTVVPGKVNYTLVNKLSYNFSGGDPNDFATILFYDWDDTLIGTLVVKKDIDSRKRVNDYVCDHFIYTDGNNVSAGDDTNLSLQDNTAATVSSLKRKDNYRGKYTTTPQALNTDGTVNDDGTVCNGVNNNINGNPDGAKFPLTNKLDYVFFKRTMVNDETTKPDATDAKYNTGDADADKALFDADMAQWRRYYKQAVKSDGTTPDWDTQYPYIHGWAVVPDYAHPEKVWTTMGGMGELTDYTDYKSYTGGDAANTGKPAELTVEEGYAFSFADFDFSNAPVTGGCLAVKAVYEPGVDSLTDRFTYRLITEPYYNKLTYKEANVGGAYSVEVTLERSNTTTGPLVGVMRAREPYIRQDNSYDLRWITVAAKNVKNDLPLNEDSELYTDKNETMYTKVDVANTDTMTFTMALSARQNKLDYYLVEGYGQSFVSGTTKIPSDINNKGKYHAVDNYNYFFDPSTASSPTNASDLTDDFYEARTHEEREGTHGFVLYGTINSLMLQSMKRNHNEIDSTTYEGYVTQGNLFDSNIKMTGGADPEYMDTIDTVIPAFQRAAQLAEAAHNSNNNTWWDVPHNCPQLSYHQLQWFLLDYINNSATAALRTESAAYDKDDSGTYISWCHLHEACVGAVSSKPTTWPVLMQAAYDGDTGKLDLLSASDVEQKFKLRDNANGTALTTANLSTFIANLQTVVQALTAQIGGSNPDPKTLTWDQVQYGLLNGTSTGTSLSDMNTYGSNNYWWYDGATSPTVGSWSDLDLAVKEAAQNLSVNTLPDGQTVNQRPAKLNQLETAFNDNAAATGSTDPAWIAATHNLGPSKPAATAGEGVKFSSFNSFKTDVTDAWEAANAAATPVTAPTWNQVQYHLIHKNDGGYTFPANDAATQPDSDDYWWKDGNQKIIDLKSLLNAARNDTASWQNLPSSAISQFKFVSDFAGTPFSNITAFKTAVKGYADIASTAALNNPNWNEVQYYLCFGSVPVNDSIRDNAAAYFWWNMGDGTAQKVSFADSGTDYATSADEIAAAIMDAAYRAQYNGNTVAWDDLTDTVLSTGRLAAAYSGSETDYTSDFTLFGPGDLNTVKTLAVKLLQNKYSTLPDTFYPTAPTATWEELQYALLNSGAYNSSITDNYWWKSADTAGNPPSVDLATTSTKLQAIANDPGDATALADMQAFFTDAVADNLEIDDGMGGTLAGYGIDLSTFPWDVLDYSGATWPLTWASLYAVFAQITYDMYDPTMGDTVYVWDDTTAVNYLNYCGYPTTPSWVTFSLPHRTPMKVALKDSELVEVQEDIVTEDKTVSEDGLTVTTVKTTKTWNKELEYYDTAMETTIVVTIPGDDVTVVATTVIPSKIVYDEETGEPLVVTGTPVTTTETTETDNTDTGDGATGSSTGTTDDTDTGDGATGSSRPTGTDDPVGPQEPTETEDPDNTGAGSGGTTTTPTDPDNTGTGDGAAGSSTGTTDDTDTGDGATGSSRPTGTTDPDDNTGTGSGGTTTTTDPTETTDPTKDDVGADVPVGPQTTTDPDPTDDTGTGSADPPLTGIVRRIKLKRMWDLSQTESFTAIHQYILGREGPPRPIIGARIQQGMGLEAARRIQV